MSDLFETIRTTFPPVLSSHLAARLGTSVNSMKRALAGAVPVMLSGLTAVAAKNTTLLYEWCQSVQPIRTDVTGILVMLGSRDAAGSALQRGEQLLNAAFADAEQAVITAVSQYAQLQPVLVRSLLELVGTTLLGALGRHAAQHALTAQDTAAALVSLQAKTRAMLPSELEGMIEVLGLRPVLRWKTNPTAAAYAVVRQAAAQQPLNRWYMAAMVVLIMTGVGVAFRALRPMHTAQQAAQTAPAETIQIINKVAAEPGSSLRTGI